MIGNATPFILLFHYHQWCKKQEVHLKWANGTFLVVHCLRICLSMQGTWVWPLLREDSTHHGATKPMHCNCWAQYCSDWSSHTLEPMLSKKRNHCKEKSAHHRKSRPCSLQIEKSSQSIRDPVQPPKAEPLANALFVQMPNKWQLLLTLWFIWDPAPGGPRPRGNESKSVPFLEVLIEAG